MTQQTKKKSVLKPLGDRVFVQRLQEDESVKGGIFIPDSAKKKQETATVISVGAGKLLKDGTFEPMPVKVNDKVLIDKYSGQEVTLEDEEYMIVRADDIVAILEE